MARALALTAAFVVALGAGLGAGYVLWGNSGDGDGGGSAAPGGSVASTETDEQAPGLEGCNHESTAGCAPGAEIVITDDQWRCRGPLADYAEEAGGRLPLKVTARFTTYVETSGPVIDIREGCVGDGTEAIDLILDVQGDGRTVGGTNDGVSIKLDAHDIDITGNVDCGPRLPGAHQDGVQAQGARNISFVDFEVGDWDEERSTCTGASAGIDFSLGGVAEIVPTGHRCIRCRVVACRRALNMGVSEGIEIRDSRFRSGNPAETEETLVTGETGLCTFQVSTCSVEPAARNNVFEGNVCEEWPWSSGRRR